ncbi:helix-turn-helix domain-containing protein [Brevibacillus laterosporus]|uniref:helix-turn-helix domain-containing protein n=1 Tax=Brevibacillus laterosporus TaxID=1465 RepID=UPI000839BDCC|nr:helix-turn-helix transcriptional regulator [Brevibacillus laterosporus]
MIKFKLKTLLEERGMTMYQLGKTTGIRPNTLSAWCKDDGVDVRSITIETLDAICQELSCNVADLIEYVEEDSEKID